MVWQECRRWCDKKACWDAVVMKKAIMFIIQRSVFVYLKVWLVISYQHKNKMCALRRDSYSILIFSSGCLEFWELERFLTNISTAPIPLCGQYQFLLKCFINLLVCTPSCKQMQLLYFTTLNYSLTNLNSNSTITREI